MKIIIDTREQLEYSFTVPSERADLYTGDYSLFGMEKHVAIERKTIPDLIGCLTNSGRDRFERELCRGKGLDFFAVVVEGSIQDIKAGNYRSQMHPNAAYNSILAFMVRYKCMFFFVPDRKRGAELVQELLTKAYEEVLKRAKRVNMTLSPKDVKQALKKLGWTDELTAHKLGLTVDSILNWKTGKSKCRGPAALLLTRFVREEKERGNDNQEGE